MKLRNALLFLALALVPFLLVSCFVQGPAAAGSIAFSVSSRAMGRSLNGAAEIVRVYLMSGDTLYPLKPAGYDEVGFTAGSATATYTSPAVPAGTYKLMIAVGVTDANGVFMTTDYADPVDVTVSPGVDTPILVTLKQSPFEDHGLWGQDVTGAAVVGSTLYASTETDLYRPTVGPVAPGSSLATIGSGKKINSLSAGYEWAGSYNSATPWLNTSQGIVPYSLLNSRLVTSFASGNGVVDVLDSAGFSAGTGSIAVYERNAGLGGTVISSGSVGEWFDVDLSQFLSGKPFLDIVPSRSGTSFVYFATSLGAFRLPTNMVGVSASAQDVLNSAVFFKVTDPAGKEIPILSLAVYPDATAGADVLLMGTEEGVYSAPLTEGSTTTAIGTATLLAGTEEMRITRIRTYSGVIAPKGSSGAQKTLAAFLSDTDVSFYDGSSVASYPFYSGLPQDLPAQINTLSFVVKAGAIDLVVVGKKGMVVFSTGWVLAP